MGSSNVKIAAGKQKQCDPLPSSNTPSHRCLSLNDECTDRFTLIWLDERSQENSLDSLRTKILLRQINHDHCLFFDNSDRFLFEIERMKRENAKLLVIMSGSFAKEILPKTQDHISTIILFCGNYNKYVDLAGQYSNVVDVCTDHATLKSCIENEISSLKFNLFVNQTLTSVISFTSSKDTDNNGAYFSYILFVDFLKHMPQTKQAKDIMLNKCKDYHRRNKKEMELIEHFRNTYTSNKAIDWYTKDSFIYRLINRAFRTEDITLWYLFRYYVIDLCTQLENVHKEQNIQRSLTLYRGQSRMPTKELEKLKSNIGCLISTNGFFSSSSNINIAKQFILGAMDTDDFKVVIYEITVSGSSLQNTVFVDIDEYIGEIGENEILFNIGSIFKIESIIYDSDFGAWTIKMKATDEGTYQINERIETMRKKFQSGNINLMFGRLLLDMNQYAKAESYFQMMLQVLPTSHKDLASVYDHIGDLNMRISNWKEALKNFNLAYEIKRKQLPSNDPDIGITLNSIGNYYRAIEDHIQALEYYTKALQCKNDRYNTAITLLNIGGIHLINKDYEEALRMCIEARDILQQIHPCPYAQVIHCHGIIGDIYLAQKDLNIAEDYYCAALEMSQNVLFIGDRLRTNCIKALADLHYNQGRKQRALSFCLDQLSFYEQHLPERHISIAHLLMKIGELSEDNDDQKIQFLQRALNIFDEHVHLEYATTACCLMMVAEYNQNRNINDKALRCYIRAIEIQKKIYPKDHSIIFETQCLIDAIES